MKLTGKSASEKVSHHYALLAIKSSDLNAWIKAGFSVSSNQIHLVDVDIMFENVKDSGELFALGFDQVPPNLTSIDGIPIFQHTKIHKVSPQHNAVSSVDHVVIHTSNEHNRFKHSMEQLGIPLRLERSDIYPGITQLFYRAGTTIEVAVLSGVPSSFLWGITLVTQDMSKSKQQLGNQSSEPKRAVQKGRQIMTIRTMTKTNMAFITPYVKSHI